MEPDSDELGIWLDSADAEHTYFVGGYQRQGEGHFDVTRGDPPLDDPASIGSGYIQVQIDGDEWKTFEGPFDDWDHVELAIYDWDENGS